MALDFAALDTEIKQDNLTYVAKPLGSSGPKFFLASSCVSSVSFTGEANYKTVFMPAVINAFWYMSGTSSLFKRDFSSAFASTATVPAEEVWGNTSLSRKQNNKHSKS